MIALSPSPEASAAGERFSIGANAPIHQPACKSSTCNCVEVGFDEGARFRKPETIRQVCEWVRQYRARMAPAAQVPAD